jgi:hypothetical protein
MFESGFGGFQGVPERNCAAVRAAPRLISPRLMLRRSVNKPANIFPIPCLLLIRFLAL